MEKQANNQLLRAGRSVSVYLMIIGIFLIPGIAVASPVSPDRLVELTNSERQKYGLGALTSNRRLYGAAEAKADAILMAQKFEHNLGNRRFSDWIKDQHYEYSYVGENLAIDFEDSEDMFAAWMASPAHRKNILNPRFSEIGIAVSEGDFQGENTLVVAQIFGAPSVPLPTAAPEPTADMRQPQTSFMLPAQIFSGPKNRALQTLANHKIPDMIRFLHLFYLNISIAIFYMAATLHLAIVRLNPQRQFQN